MRVWRPMTLESQQNVQWLVKWCLQCANFVTPLVQKTTITQTVSGKGHPKYVNLRNHGKVIIWSVSVRHSTQVDLLHLIAWTLKRKKLFQRNGEYTMLKLLSKPTKAESIDCTIGIPIIHVIVAELLLEPMMEEEENDINYEAKALSIVQLNNAEIDVPYYSVHISNAILFQLIVSYVDFGISFCQCVQIVSKTKETQGIGNIGYTNVGKVILYIWYLCATIFNAFNTLLTDYVWAFSIAFDSGNKRNQSYVDVCFCFYLDCQVYNLHLHLNTKSSSYPNSPHFQARYSYISNLRSQIFSRVAT